MIRLLAVFVLVGGSGLRAAEDSDLKQVAIDAVGEYVITDIDDTETPFQLVSEPVIRFALPPNIDEGDVMIWTRDGRPMAAAQVFHFGTNEDKIWLHEFQSLSTRPLVMTRNGLTLWTPGDPGVTWAPLPADFAPAMSAPARLTQMKRLARRFTGNEQTPGEGSGEQMKDFEMRMKPREIFRYESEKNGAADGVMFCFVQEDRTDPEMLLMIEATAADGTGSWRYAFAPLSCWAIQFRLDDQEVGTYPNRMNRSVPSDTFHNLRWP